MGSTRADRILPRLNLLRLLVVVFLPFPTRLVAGALHHKGSERVFVTMYGLNLLAIRVAGHGLDAYARRGHLYSPDVEGAELQSERRDLLTTVAAYVVAILIALALPTVAVAVYSALPCTSCGPSGGCTFPSLAFVALAGERSATWPSSTGSGGRFQRPRPGTPSSPRRRPASRCSRAHGTVERAHVPVQLPLQPRLPAAKK